LPRALRSKRLLKNNKLELRPLWRKPNRRKQSSRPKKQLRSKN